MCNGKKKKKNILHNKKIDTNVMHTGVKIVMKYRASSQPYELTSCKKKLSTYLFMTNISEMSS